MAEEKVQELIGWKNWLKEQMPLVTGFCLKVVLAVIVFFIGTKIIRLVIKWLRKTMNKTKVDAGVVQFVCSASRVLLYVLLAFNIAIGLGVQATSVAALLGTLGITVGMGLQGSLANLAGGMLLLIFKPFVVGDYIILDQSKGCEGTVAKIEMCYTTLLTIDNKHIVIPNGTLADSTVINVTAQQNRRLEIKVGISYEADLVRAKQILLQILAQDEDTGTDREEALVYVDELADSAVILGLRVWVPTEAYWRTKWRLNEKIKQEFDANGIEIPYNQMEVYVHQK